MHPSPQKIPHEPLESQREDVVSPSHGREFIATGSFLVRLWAVFCLFSVIVNQQPGMAINFQIKKVKFIEVAISVVLVVIVVALNQPIVILVKLNVVMSVYVVYKKAKYQVKKK